MGGFLTSDGPAIVSMLGLVVSFSWCDTVCSSIDSTRYVLGWAIPKKLVLLYQLMLREKYKLKKEKILSGLFKPPHFYNKTFMF